MHHFMYRIKVLPHQSIERLALFLKQATIFSNTTKSRRSRYEKINLRIKANGTLVLKDICILKNSENRWLKVRLPRDLTKKINNLMKGSNSITMDIRLKMRHENLYQGLPFIHVHKVRAKKPAMLSDQTKMTPQNKCIGHCCPQPLELDFERLGWHWVIYPKKITVNYCAGSCSAKHMNRDERADIPLYLQTLQAMLDNLKIAQSSSSCVADKTTSIVMIYTDLEGSVRTSYNSIRRIDSCKCL